MFSSPHHTVRAEQRLALVGFMSCVCASRVTFTSSRRGSRISLPSHGVFHRPLGLPRRLCPTSTPSPRPDHRVPQAADGSRGKSRGRKLRTQLSKSGTGVGEKEGGAGRCRENRRNEDKGRKIERRGRGRRTAVSSHSAVERKSG